MRRGWRRAVSRVAASLRVAAWSGTAELTAVIRTALHLRERSPRMRRGRRRAGSPAAAPLRLGVFGLAAPSGVVRAGDSRRKERHAMVQQESLPVVILAAVSVLFYFWQAASMRRAAGIVLVVSMVLMYTAFCLGFITVILRY
jgi:hypothetical protein